MKDGETGMKIYHFTTIYYWERILRDGVIKTTESNVDLRPGREHAGPDVVWLLDTPTVDYNHGITSVDGVIPGTKIKCVDKTRLRFEVSLPDFEVHRWADWLRTQKNYHASSRYKLENTGGGPNATRHWWVTEKCIDMRYWRSVVDMKTATELLTHEAIKEERAAK